MKSGIQQEGEQHRYPVVPVEAHSRQLHTAVKNSVYDKHILSSNWGLTCAHTAGIGRVATEQISRIEWTQQRPQNADVPS